MQRWHGELREAQRAAVVGYCCRNRGRRGWATLNGESIHPAHQHVQSYRTSTGDLQPAEIRFFAITETPGHAPYWSSGLTAESPAAARYTPSILAVYPGLYSGNQSRGKRRISQGWVSTDE